MIDVPVTRGASRDDVDHALSLIEDQPGFGLASRSDVLRLESAAIALQDPELTWRARLLLAELLGRGGSVAEAIQAAGEVLELADAQGHGRLVARSHLVLGWCYRDIGDLATYLDHAVKAVEHLDDEAPVGVRALHLIRLADALDECGSPEEARFYYDLAEEVAVAGGHTARLISCLNNRAYGEYLAGDLVRAETTVERLLEVSRAHGAPLRSNTLDTMARIQIALGSYDEAVATMGRAFAAYEAAGVQEAMSPAEFLLTLALAHRLRGDLEAAQRSLDECSDMATTAGLSSVLVRVRQEQAEIDAAAGDFEAALDGYRAFHAAEGELLSEQRAAQATLRQAVLRTEEVRAEAGRLQRLDDYRTGMIATISHELRNPLAVVTSHLELLSSEHLPPGAERSLAAMQSGADRLLGLADSLLELTRLEVGGDRLRQDLVDLDDVVTGVRAMLEVLADGRGVRLVHEPAAPAFVVGDPDELHRALVNLVGNAVKYSDPGGSVTLSVHRSGDEVVFSCTDEGLGISGSDQERLFTEFFRSTNPEALGRTGTGLGLVIVQRIAARHGGRLSVRSTLGLGSTFRLHLQAAPGSRGPDVLPPA